MNKEVEFLKRIVVNAKEMTMEHFEVESKGDKSDLVTSLDLKIEKYLINEIKKEYKDFDIVSEEFNSNKKVSKNCFVIDPIDGTVNFANGVPLWGIQVACIKNYKTVASVIYLPKLNELYCADETGAYLNNNKISIKQVPVNKALYSIDGSNTTKYVEKMQKYSTSRRNFGSLCVAMAFMATGRIHGVAFKPNKPWDYESGIFLCEKAGASVKNIDGFHACAMNDEFLNIIEKEMTD